MAKKALVNKAIALDSGLGKDSLTCVQAWPSTENA